MTPPHDRSLSFIHCQGSIIHGRQRIPHIGFTLCILPDMNLFTPWYWSSTRRAFNLESRIIWLSESLLFVPLTLRALPMNSIPGMAFDVTYCFLGLPPPPLSVKTDVPVSDLCAQYT